MAIGQNINNNQELIVPRFFLHAVKNEEKSAKAGRPIFDEIECCEIRLAANKYTKVVAPAHEVFRREMDNSTGDVKEYTYAIQFSEQYKAFKNGEAQVLAGTPLQELPFLTQAKRLELKALNIHTAEALAALDGQPLRQLGPGGRELKNQAQAYIDKASGSANVLQMAAQIAELQERLAALQGGAPVAAPEIAPDIQADQPVNTASPFAAMEPDDIKNWIQDATGERPRGNPSKATLVAKADEINAELKRKAEQEAA